jgi:hypothetical protein
MRITESQIRQIIRQEVKRVIVEGNHSGHDTHSASDSTPYEEAVLAFADALAKDPKFGPGDDEYDAYNRSSRGDARKALRQAKALNDERMDEKDSEYDDTHEPVDENHRPSNRSQMMFPLHALRESKLRLRRPS